MRPPPIFFDRLVELRSGEEIPAVADVPAAGLYAARILPLGPRSLFGGRGPNRAIIAQAFEQQRTQEARSFRKPLPRRAGRVAGDDRQESG